MSFTLRAAKRERLRLLIGLAGGTGAGKTWSAMALAKGLNDGKPFAVVDTENGRASHYADEFQFEVVDLTAPFSPERYQQAIEACVKAGHEVIVIDSMSHEWEGVGGLLEQHEAEMGGNQNKNLSAWIRPKMAHRKFVTFLLQVDAHIILCFRAAEKVEAQRGANGKMEIVPKRTLTGLDGWVPITEKSLPFELTLSCLLTADRPGVPKPIKLQEQHRSMVPLDEPITENTGRLLREWALGTRATEPDAKSNGSPSAPSAPQLVTRLLELAERLGKREPTAAAVARTRSKHAARPVEFVTWLETQIANAQAKVDQLTDEPDVDLFADEPEPQPQEA